MVTKRIDKKPKHKLTSVKRIIHKITRKKEKNARSKSKIKRSNSKRIKHPKKIRRSNKKTGRGLFSIKQDTTEGSCKKPVTSCEKEKPYVRVTGSAGCRYYFYHDKNKNMYRPCRSDPKSNFCRSSAKMSSYKCKEDIDDKNIYENKMNEYSKQIKIEKDISNLKLRLETAIDRTDIIRRTKKIKPYQRTKFGNYYKFANDKEKSEYPEINFEEFININKSKVDEITEKEIKDIMKDYDNIVNENREIKKLYKDLEYVGTNSLLYDYFHKLYNIDKRYTLITTRSGEQKLFNYKFLEKYGNEDIVSEIIEEANKDMEKRRIAQEQRRKQEEEYELYREADEERYKSPQGSIASEPRSNKSVTDTQSNNTSSPVPDYNIFKQDSMSSVGTVTSTKAIPDPFI